VTPLGCPAKLRFANSENPFVLFKLTTYAVDWPCVTSAEGGAAVRVKSDEATIVKGSLVETLFSLTVTINGPLVAPVGTVTTILSAFAFVTGALMRPPDWLARVTSRKPSELFANWDPVMVTSVPTGATLGAKSVMAGFLTPGGVNVPVTPAGTLESTLKSRVKKSSMP
jgi:hypothetical protein